VVALVWWCAREGDDKKMDVSLVIRRSFSISRWPSGAGRGDRGARSTRTGGRMADEEIEGEERLRAEDVGPPESGRRVRPSVSSEAGGAALGADAWGLYLATMAFVGDSLWGLGPLSARLASESTPAATRSPQLDASKMPK
jgi:hypothetical protein